MTKINPIVFFDIALPLGLAGLTIYEGKQKEVGGTFWGLVGLTTVCALRAFYALSNQVRSEKRKLSTHTTTEIEATREHPLISVMTERTGESSLRRKEGPLDVSNMEEEVVVRRPVVVHSTSPLQPVQWAPQTSPMHSKGSMFLEKGSDMIEPPPYSSTLEIVYGTSFQKGHEETQAHEKSIMDWLGDPSSSLDSNPTSTVSTLSEITVLLEHIIDKAPKTRLGKTAQQAVERFNCFQQMQEEAIDKVKTYLLKSKKCISEMDENVKEIKKDLLAQIYPIEADISEASSDPSILDLISIPVVDRIDLQQVSQKAKTIAEKIGDENADKIKSVLEKSSAVFSVLAKEKSEMMEDFKKYLERMKSVFEGEGSADHAQFSFQRSTVLQTPYGQTSTPFPYFSMARSSIQKEPPLFSAPMMTENIWKLLLDLRVDVEASSNSKSVVTQKEERTTSDLEAKIKEILTGNEKLKEENRQIQWELKQLAKELDEKTEEIKNIKKVSKEELFKKQEEIEEIGRKLEKLKEVTRIYKKQTEAERENIETETETVIRSLIKYVDDLKDWLGGIKEEPEVPGFQSSKWNILIDKICELSQLYVSANPSPAASPARKGKK